MNKWEVWVKGVLSAAIGGAANAGLSILVKPEVFNLGAGLHNLSMMAAGGALIAVLNFLKQSPLPNGG